MTGCVELFVCLYVWHTGGVQSFSRLHPLACWFGSMMLCFAGGILGNFLLGEPLLSPFQSEKEVLTATVVWWEICGLLPALINYCPSSTQPSTLCGTVNEIASLTRATAGPGKPLSLAPITTSFRMHPDRDTEGVEREEMWGGVKMREWKNRHGR